MFADLRSQQRTCSRSRYPAEGGISLASVVSVKFRILFSEAFVGLDPAFAAKKAPDKIPSECGTTLGDLIGSPEMQKQISGWSPPVPRELKSGPKLWGNASVGFS